MGSYELDLEEDFFILPSIVTSASVFFKCFKLKCVFKLSSGVKVIYEGSNIANYLRFF